MVRIKNVLTEQQDTLEVPEEETLSQVGATASDVWPLLSQVICHDHES